MSDLLGGQSKSQGEISEPDIERIVTQALDAQSSDTLRLVGEKKEEILRMVESLKTQKIVMDDHWGGELSRRFLPKFVVNHKSHKIHAVRDAMCTGCGFEWRNSNDYELSNAVNDYARCETPGCQKLFARYEGQ